MPSISTREVESYSVSVFRGSTLNHTRAITLRLRPTDTGSSQQHVTFHFLSSPSTNWVDITNGSSRIQMSLDRYDDMYHLLQTEKPVFFTAHEFNNYQFAGLTTDPEATGEGFRDAQAA